ncbi:MAG: hypothetical protein HOF36_01385 [Candidatus Marinimicrobia bacterium]|jgi:hypothetical protein|nr:hypothetical protein [Candidatus Neomarinimicrobiota bacterium]MBT3949707.1 hypothetical protein [Candidatus Neomarinimicrobiota bacterium]MBT4253142.1 hypothetical protein [Candidatus Neomarinimicrobiota bacterium]MBT4419150.1 hypothetical protein [Candidatus Neomarinimicrobiota bacterium]MBT5467380.1 hypothetical protein [Candidatus Neomarinimicrobiota bacterium]
MSYPEYKNTYLTLDGYNNGRPVKIKNLPPQYEGEAYVHMMQYDESIITQFDKGRKIAEYYSTRYTEFVPIDIDLEGELEEAKILTIIFIESLVEEYGIDANWILIYFSGKKGFHLLIPSILFNISPHKQLEALLKHLVKRLIASHPIERAVDEVIYCRNRWIRLPNSVHPGTALFKIPLLFGELKQLSIKEIRAVARSPKWIEAIPASELFPNPQLSEIFQDCLNQGSGVGSIDTAKLLSEGVNEGERGNTAFLIARGLRDQGVSEDEAKSLVIGWNQQNNPPIIDSGWPNRQIQSTYNKQFTMNIDSISPKLQALLRNHQVFRTNLLSDAEHRCVIALIALTNTVDKPWHSIRVKRGQVITSLHELGRKAHPKGPKDPVTVARNAVKKLVNEGALVKVVQLSGNRGILYEWQGEFAAVFQQTENHPPKPPHLITPETRINHSVTVRYEDNLEKLITPIDHLIMSSTKKVSPFEEI